MKKSCATCICCIALGLLSIATNVHAKRPGFTGLTALADSPDAAFWNPASITRVPESLELQLATAYSNSDFEVEEATFAGGDPDKQDDINLIPGENDSDEELHEMTNWVVEKLGPDVPMHFTAFHPDWKMLDIKSTPSATLTRARGIAIDNGVHYAYTGNVHDNKGSSTWCHSC